MRIFGRRMDVSLPFVSSLLGVNISTLKILM